MRYTVLELITGAYYTSGVVSKDYQQPTDVQVNEGLAYLNAIIAEMTVNDGMIPYYLEYNFAAEKGKGDYFIPDLIDTDTLCLFLGDDSNKVRYPIQKISRSQFFGSSRAENIQSLPSIYYLERKVGGAIIYIYHLPEQNYAMQLHGRFRLGQVDLPQNLSLSLDLFYIDFLKYSLARKICAEYAIDVPPGVIEQLQRYQMGINKSMQGLDLSTQKVSLLGNQSGTNWAQVNLGNGWNTQG